MRASGSMASGAASGLEQASPQAAVSPALPNPGKGLVLCAGACM